MIKLLKIVKERKPNLKLYPNHYHYKSEGGRIYNSQLRGPAVSDGKGWYKK